MTRPPPRSDDVEEAAALWYARMSSELRTPADEAAFDAWLQKSPDHGGAYAEFCSLSGRFDALADSSELATLRVEAQLTEENRRKPFLVRFGAGFAVSGIAAAAAVAFMYFAGSDVERHDWTTARGEIREITLSDGTEAVLGSDTRLSIAFAEDRRQLQIERGQVFFDVAHDADRPFITGTNGRTVTALGTAFDVRSFPNDMTVTLVRGRVAIGREGEPPEAVLNPGQQFRSAFGVTSVHDVDAVAETSWRTGIFDFNDVSLVEAVARFNRSAPNSIVIGDPSLGELRVSGVFRADDPVGFATALAPAYPILIRQQTSGDVVLERQP